MNFKEIFFYFFHIKKLKKKGETKKAISAKKKRKKIISKFKYNILDERNKRITNRNLGGKN